MVVSSVVPAKNSAILKAAGKVNVLWLDWKVKLGVELIIRNRNRLARIVGERCGGDSALRLSRNRGGFRHGGDL